MTHISHTFVFYIDPAHGFLAVLRADLAQYGLSARDFTQCSYVSEDGTRLYLEEDCDAGKFIEAYRARFGKPPIITERHINSSAPHSNFIRRMPRNAAGEWKPFAH